jgi:hypothetical protein
MARRASDHCALRARSLCHVVARNRSARMQRVLCMQRSNPRPRHPCSLFSSSLKYQTATRVRFTYRRARAPVDPAATTTKYTPALGGNRVACPGERNVCIVPLVLMVVKNAVSGARTPQ